MKLNKGFNMKHIAITQTKINGAEVNSVNARDLHSNFEVKTRFADWVKRQLDLFVEDKDFLKIEKPNDNNTIEYIVTLETAKHIAMLQKNKKGMETRQYFIDVEEQARDKQMKAISDMMHKTKFLLESNEHIGDTITDHDKRLTNLEKNRRMESWQEANLLDAKNKKVYELGNNDEKLIKKLHRLVWSKFKKRFNLPRYNELTAGRYEDGLMWLNNVTLADVV